MKERVKGWAFGGRRKKRGSKSYRRNSTRRMRGRLILMLTIDVSTDRLKWRPMPDKNSGNLHYAITYNVIWANQKTESFEYHWLRALAMVWLNELSHHFVGHWMLFQVLLIHWLTYRLPARRTIKNDGWTNKKIEILRNVIMLNVIWANQNIESCVYIEYILNICLMLNVDNWRMDNPLVGP